MLSRRRAVVCEHQALAPRCMKSSRGRARKAPIFEPLRVRVWNVQRSHRAMPLTTPLARSAPSFSARCSANRCSLAGWSSARKSLRSSPLRPSDHSAMAATRRASSSRARTGGNPLAFFAPCADTSWCSPAFRRSSRLMPRERQSLSKAGWRAVHFPGMRTSRSRSSRATHIVPYPSAPVGSLSFESSCPSGVGAVIAASRIATTRSYAL